MSKKDNNILLNFLALLDTTWGRIAIIGIIFWAGFRFGCVFQEFKMNREYANQEDQKRQEWNAKENEYQQRLLEQQANIKEQEIIIKLYETKSR